LGNGDIEIKLLENLAQLLTIDLVIVDDKNIKVFDFSLNG